MNTVGAPQSIGFGRRLAAALLDFFLAALLTSLIGSALHSHYPAAGAPEQTVSNAAALMLPAILLLFWRVFQGTPGKLLLGCRIGDSRTGGRARPAQPLLRMVGYPLSLAPVGLGFFWMIWDRGCQGWHDKLARTRAAADDDAAKSLAQLNAEIL